MPLSSAPHIVSTAVIGLIVTGLLFRTTRPGLHWKFMLAAFLTDFALLLYVELSRSAIDTVRSAGDGLILFHAFVSVGVLVCYGAMFWLGFGLLRKTRPRRATHRNVGIAFCLLRGINYATSFIV